MADGEFHFPTSLSDRDREIAEKLRREYSIHDALGAAHDGTCSDCEMYERHGIHWDSCGNRGKIHMGWCSIEAWQAFRKGWFEEFGEMADFKQEAREKVAKAIEKGALFRVEIVEGHPSEKPDLASVPKNTVAWIREKKDGEWKLAIAQNSTWHYMLATNDRITGSISPLSAVRDVVIVPRPEEPKVRPADKFTMHKPAIRTNPDYDLPFAMPVIDPAAWAVAEEKVVPTTLKIDGLRKPYKEGNEIEHPAHYNMFPVEAIDVCEHLGFNLGNVVKYTMRADFKGDRIKDLKKALFYLQREIDREGPIPDTLDDWWRQADQSDLLLTIHTWLLHRQYLDQENSGCSINVHEPWQVKMRKPDRDDEVINFSEVEKAEIIAAMEAKPKK